MKNSNSGMGFIPLILILCIVSAVVLTVSHFVVSQMETQGRINSKGTIEDILSSLRSMMSQSEFCQNSIYDTNENLLKMDSTRIYNWRNNIEIEIGEIKINNGTISLLKKSNSVDSIVIESMSLRKRFSASLPIALANNEIMYPSVLKVSFLSPSGKMGFAPVEININIVVDRVTQVLKSCNSVFHTMNSALGIRRAYALQGVGCQAGTNYLASSTIDTNLFNANVCTDDSDKNTGDPEPDRVCDDNARYAIPAHPLYGSMEWKSYNQNGRILTMAPLLTTRNPIDSSTRVMSVFTPSQEGRCWFVSTSQTVLDSYPLKVNPITSLPTNYRWMPKEIFVMPNRGDGAMTLGCNSRNGWALSGCIRKSYSVNRSSDADADIGIDPVTKDSYCYTYNHMTPHEDGAWTSAKEDLQVVCIRMNE